MSPRLFVPAHDSDAVQKLLTALRTEKKPVAVQVAATAQRAQEGCCYQNVGEKVSRVGGRAQLGWAVWQHENLFIEAEPHAVYDPIRKGQSWIDPTPNFFPDGSPCREILFVPNEGTRDSRSMVIEDNVRVALVDDPRVYEALELAAEKIALLNSIPKEWQSEELMYHYSAEQMQRKMQLEFRIASLLSAASRA